MLSLAMTGGKKEFRDDRCKVNARPTDEQFVQVGHSVLVQLVLHQTASFSSLAVAY